MTYVIEGAGALVNEEGEEQPLKADDLALVNPPQADHVRKPVRRRRRVHKRSE